MDMLRVFFEISDNDTSKYFEDQAVSFYDAGAEGFNMDWFLD